MTTPTEARAALGDALSGLDGIRYYANLGANIDPPATIVSLPRLAWEAICAGPTSATFLVYLMVPLNDRAVDRLQEMLPAVVEAIESYPDAVVTTATPLVSPFGGPDLPAYEITVEVAL
ncbi:MAG TPA: hypothetical protein VGP26_14650 [Actinophytocola sp.]|jgi:hypothetical protein|nr:hypothetical protein [Actinophytocola sp.]